MKLKSGYEDSKPRLEMIPLMDVMFLLLVFFVYSIFSMSVHRGLKVTLPNAQGETVAKNTQLVTLSADHSLALDKIPLTEDALLLQVSARYQKDQTPVLISADRKASMGYGLELLEKLRRGGVQKVSFQVSGKVEPKP